MKTLIICFSQTGNTRKVAESIQSGIRDVGGSCDLKTLADVDHATLADYDLVGLGCPVFYYKEPFNVRQFIESLSPSTGQQWFVFCSHGAVLGVTLLSMTEALEKKGMVVIGSHHTYADVSVPFYPYPTVTTGHPDALDLKAARDFGAAMVDCSRAVTRGDLSGVLPPSAVTEDWATKEAGMLSLEFMAQVMPRLSINGETCIQCGECQEACPVEGIDVESDPPRIQDPCIYCWHCAKTCPTGAIEADWGPLVGMAPQNYARYIKALNEAEARGEFRWLVDPDTIDYETPLHMQRKHKKNSE